MTSISSWNRTPLDDAINFGHLECRKALEDAFARKTGKQSDCNIPQVIEESPEEDEGESETESMVIHGEETDHLGSSLPIIS